MRGVATLRSCARASPGVVALVAAECAPMLSMALLAGLGIIIPPITELVTSGGKPAVGRLLEHEVWRAGSGAGRGRMSRLPADDAKRGTAVGPKGLAA